MATDLTTIFGNEIKVTVQPRLADKQYSGYPGAHGLTVMHLGTRGRLITISGRLRESGGSYSTARSSLQSAIDTIESYLNSAADSYSYKGDTYNYIVFESFRILERGGKSVHWTGSDAVCDFIVRARQLI